MSSGVGKNNFIVRTDQYPQLREFKDVLDKYDRVFELFKNHLDESYTVVNQEPVSDEEALKGVNQNHLKSLKSTGSNQGQLQAEFLGSGGTMEAIEKALDTGGTAYHIGGGYHHATKKKSTRMDLINDMVVGIENTLENDDLETVLVVDLDVHHGDGTSDVYFDRPELTQISAHGWGIYPSTGWIDEIGEGEAKGNQINIPMPKGTSDDVYNAILEDIIPEVVDQVDPDLTVYQSGVDPHAQDSGGNLDLTLQGLYRRDSIVAEAVDGSVAVVSGGGYGPRAAEANVNTMAAFAGEDIVFEDELNDETPEEVKDKAQRRKEDLAENLDSWYDF